MAEKYGLGRTTGLLTVAVPVLGRTTGLLTCAGIPPPTLWLGIGDGSLAPVVGVFETGRLTTCFCNDSGD